MNLTGGRVEEKSAVSERCLELGMRRSYQNRCVFRCNHLWQSTSSHLMPVSTGTADPLYNPQLLILKMGPLYWKYVVHFPG